MRETVTIYEAKTHLSRLIKRAEAGETIVIRRGDTPVAQLSAYETTARVRRPGAWKGRVVIAPDFDDYLPPEFEDDA